MARPRAADDFAAIRARMEELRRERSQAAPDHEIQSSKQRRSLPAESGERAGTQIGTQAVSRPGTIALILSRLRASTRVMGDKVVPASEAQPSSFGAPTAALNLWPRQTTSFPQ